MTVGFLSFAAAAGPPSQFTSALNIGAGGWLVGIDINPDGTRLARADTYGAYLWSGTQWNQLVTQSTMPAAYFGYVGTGTSQIYYNISGGCYEVCSAPSNSSIIYMMINGWVFKSTDKGQTFSVTGNGSNVGLNGDATHPVTMASNSSNRMCGRKMAVDPANPSIVLAGTDTLGLYLSTDGAANWSLVAPVPVGTGIINYNIVFDPTSTVGGITKTMYAYTNGATAGVYRSTDGGSTWALTASGPATCQHMVCSQTGVVWAIDGASGNSNGALWQFASGAWTKITAAGATGDSVAVDPSNANRIVVGGPGGNLNITTNGGSTWSGFNTISRAATDIPWLASCNELSMSNGDMIFDPSLSNTLVFGQGIGVWTTSPLNTNAAIVWTSASNGIEQLVSRDVIAPNGVPIVAVSDRSTFYLSNPSTFPSNNNSNTFQNAFSLNVTWGVDWAKTNTSFVCGITGDINGFTPFDNSGFSSDGGQTWQVFNSYYQDVAASAISNDGTGQAQIAVPSIVGLSDWSAGSGTIIRVIPYNPTINNSTTMPNVSLRRFWPATISGSNIILQGSSFSGTTTTNGRLIVTVQTGPLTTNNLNYTITNVVSNGGLVQIAVTSTSSANIVGTKINVSGVTMSGATVVNGDWVVSAETGNNLTLQASTFVGGDTYISGGVAKKFLPQGGCIAASTSSTMIMVGGAQDYPQVTQDGGVTWSELHFPTGLTAGVVTGWVNASFLNRHIIAADPNTANKFYLYNTNAGIGMYTWDPTNGMVQVGSTVVANSNFNASLRAVPGYSGHLFLSIGSQGSAGPGSTHPGGGALRWSINGGLSWNSIANTAEPKQVAVGAIAPGSDYPTVYMNGWVNNIYSLWRTTGTFAQWQSGANTGSGLTWTNVLTGNSATAGYALGRQDGVAALAADQITWNKWYMGFGGSAFVYGQQN